MYIHVDMDHQYIQEYTCRWGGDSLLYMKHQERKSCLYTLIGRRG